MKKLKQTDWRFFIPLVGLILSFIYEKEEDEGTIVASMFFIQILLAMYTIGGLIKIFI